jgi:hypothetical protein
MRTRAHRVRVQKFLNFKHFTGSGPTKTLNRPDPGQVRVQQILISRVRVQKFVDPMGTNEDPNNEKYGVANGPNYLRNKGV